MGTSFLPLPLKGNVWGLKCLVINGHVLDESRAQALVNGIMNNNELVYLLYWYFYECIFDITELCRFVRCKIFILWRNDYNPFVENFVDSTGAAYFLNNLKTLRNFHHLVLAGNGNINSKTKLAIKGILITFLQLSHASIWHAKSEKGWGQDKFMDRNFVRNFQTHWFFDI